MLIRVAKPAKNAIGKLFQVHPVPTCTRTRVTTRFQLARPVALVDAKEQGGARQSQRVNRDQGEPDPSKFPQPPRGQTVWAVDDPVLEVWAGPDSSKTKTGRAGNSVSHATDMGTSMSTSGSVSSVRQLEGRGPSATCHQSFENVLSWGIRSITRTSTSSSSAILRVPRASVNSTDIHSRASDENGTHLSQH